MRNFKEYLFEAKETENQHEYDHEGEMAKSQLYSMINNSKQIISMLEDNTNLPEWVQSKLTLAHDYVSTVSDYLSGKQNEVKEGFDHNSPKYLRSAIVRHTGALNRAVRDKNDNDKRYHMAMIAKAEAEHRRRDIQDFEEKKTKQK